MMKGVRPGWAVKTIVLVVLTSLLFRCVSASAVSSTNHTVGGETGWSLISNLQLWSSSTSFYTGDNLVFKYGPMHDLLEVNQMDYIMCRTIHPIATHTDGSTVVPLTSPGTRYFICGRRGHCARGLRLMVQVIPQLAVNDPTTAPPPQQSPSDNSPAPSPAADDGNDSNGGNHGSDSRGGGHRPPRSPLSPNPSHGVPPPPNPGDEQGGHGDIPEVPLPPIDEEGTTTAPPPPPRTPPCQTVPPPPCRNGSRSAKIGMMVMVYSALAAWMMTTKVF